MNAEQKKERSLILQSKIHANTFQSAMKLSLSIAQCFGFFPINLREGTHNNSLKFCLSSWRNAYSLVTFIAFTEETIKKLCVELPKEQNILSIDETVFYLNSVIQFILMFKLSSEWPAYMKEWHKVEMKCKSATKCVSLKKTLNVIVSSILIFAIVEHFLITTYKLKTCIDETSTISEGIERYFLSNYDSAFIIMDYSLWKGLILEFINIQMTFIWNYVDVLIMLIGSALKFRLKQVTLRVEFLNKVKVQNEQEWKRLRKDYQLVVSLCNATNKRISSLIITSFLMNLYFILKQIFKTLMKRDNSIAKAYFYMSFALLVTRISCVIIFGSGIHDEWRDVRFALNNVPTSAYNSEVDRFISNVATYELVLSGENFFSIRRSLILQIAGTVVTYELILIQFNSELLRNSIE